MHNPTVIKIDTLVNSPIEKVWDCYTNPEHIVKWNNASEDWHTTHSSNDLKLGGRFLSRMEAKDGSAGFDFEGTYDDVEENKLIKYTMDDGRKVSVNFETVDDGTKINVAFDAEETHSVEMQKDGWQSILNNFKNYVETH